VDESAAWLEQAKADREAGESLLRGGRAWARCQVVAKYQQCAEKAVKGLVVALREAGILHSEPGRGHGVARFIKVLLRLPHAADNRAPQQHLRGLLNQTVRDGIAAIDAIAPRWPAPGERPRRNTEYPFVDEHGDWTFPAAEAVFSDKEVDRFRQLTYDLLAGVGRVISAIRRRPT
jgi:HEPN domain-containing protein